MATLDIKVVQGNRCRVTATFTALGATSPGDPSTVKFEVLASVGVLNTYVYGVDAQVVRVSAGVYYLDFVAATKGTWWAKVSGYGATGINAVAEASVQAEGTVIS